MVKSVHMIHVGILGAGNISETHARAARETEGARIVAVHGRNREKAERLADAYGGRPYADLDSFLAHRPLDVVLVGSPSGLHAGQGVAAARRGLHVRVEKPIDISTERADALIPGYPRRVELTGTEGTVILEQNRIVAAPAHAAPRPNCYVGGVGRDPFRVVARRLGRERAQGNSGRLPAGHRDGRYSGL